MRRLRPLLLALCPLALVLGAVPTTSAQDQDAEAPAAVAAAEEIFRLAYERKFNAMYDRIHPDARAVVPRVAAVNVFERLYADARAGLAEPTGFGFVEWTWGVTGQTYPYAAAVDFEQPYVEGGEERVLEDTMYLVQWRGDWRWFFGSDRQSVDELIRTYGGELAAAPPLTDGNLIENAVADLDAYYGESFASAGVGYETPGVVAVPPGESVQTACGPAAPGFWAFYCPPDATVYLDVDFLTQVGRQADFAAVFVVAHEWAHHVQTVLGIRRVQSEAPDEWNEVYSKELELMADCLSGAYARDLYTRGRLEQDDIEETVQFTMQYLGDPEYIDQFDPQAHGTAEDRVQAIGIGYESGIVECAKIEI